MKWIRERREQLGITQEDLAARLQVRGHDFGRTAISHWEKGRYKPPLDNTEFVRAFADVLRLDVQTVLRLSGFEVVSGHSVVGERLAFIADRLPPAKQQHLLKIAETFLEN